jgi:methylated-DNA-[protein]-cysteine S-methyltransferase
VTVLTRVLDSPLGPLCLSADTSGRVSGLWIGARPPASADESSARGRHRDGARRILDVAATQLDEYFGGARRFFDIPMAMGGSAFQQEVWAALREIPFGTTVSYGQLATRLGRNGAARAVGHANARNPIPIIVPCHRVVGSSGQLTGYGGGLLAKQRLLDLETGLSPRCAT